MSHKPSVSFIIPFYNSAKTLPETLESVMNQTYTRFDVWIINDGSTEPDSLALLQNLAGKPKLHILHQDNAGPSVARNLAIRQCGGDIIVPLDADDKIRPTALETAIPHLLGDSVGVVYGDLAFFGERRDTKIQEDFDLKKALVYNPVAVCSLIKKQVFEQCGYFDEFLSKKGLEDWEFWIRIAAHGWQFKHIPQTLFDVRVTHDSRTFQVANKNLDALKAYIYQKHAGVLAQSYQELFYEKKMLAETPDYRIGNRLLRPWRWTKKIMGR